MPKMRKLADLTAEELDEIKSIRQEASTSKAIELREEPSETPSQLSIALDESCVSLTPSLFEGLETQGKNMGILRQVCGVTKEQEEGQQEEEQQTEQQQQQLLLLLLLPAITTLNLFCSSILSPLSHYFHTGLVVCSLPRVAFFVPPIVFEIRKLC